MSAARKKKDNIHIRVEPEQKEVISKAATLLGLDLSSFVLQNSLKIAREKITAMESLTLSQQDSELFLHSLGEPQKANDNFKSAYKKYQDLFTTKT